MNIPIKEMKAELKTIRRDLHRIPELGLQEFKTTLYIEEKLKSFGITHIERMLETGVIALIKGTCSESSIAFRADIDALTITEPPKAYASCHKGCMHACGHDGHMAILLGFAKNLMAQKELPKTDVLLIFQPAEEGPGGAQLLVEKGLLKKYNIKQIIGCHIFPDVPEGKIACKKGSMMARNGEVLIEIAGKASHGAQPHLGADAIVAAGGILSGIHTIVSRNISPLDGGVLTFGKINGGEACNVIAASVQIEGTMRAFSNDIYETMVERLETLVPAIAQGYGCIGTVTFNHMYQVVYNDSHLVDTLKNICGTNYMTSPPYMLSEDFSFYQQEIPGLFFFLGAGSREKGFTAPLHNAMFDFDEDILYTGVEIYNKLLDTLGGV